MRGSAETKTEYHAGANAAKRFKAFTRAIIAVPKSEIDDAAKKLPLQKAKAQRIEKPE